MAILVGIKEKLGHIGEVASELSANVKNERKSYKSDYQNQISNLVRLYEDAQKELKLTGFGQISEIMPSVYVPLFPNKEQLLSMLTEVTAGCVAGITAIKELLNRQALPEEFVNKLKGFRKRLETIEDIDPLIHKNLDKAILEMEHGHYLASALISARVVVWILQQIPPEEKDLENKTKKKIETLINMGIIDKSSKDEIKKLIQAAGLARNFVSHRISVFPEPEEAMILLGNAVKLAKIYTEFKKMGGLKEE